MLNEYIIKPTPLSLDKNKDININNQQRTDSYTSPNSSEKLIKPELLNRPNFSKNDDSYKHKNIDEQFPSNISLNESLLQPKFFSSDNIYIK